MRCPVDDSPLREVTRSGVKLDLCSDCRGIWLDRGELDHLLEAAGEAEDEFASRRDPASRLDAAPTRAARSDSRSRDDDDDDDDDDRRDRAPRSDDRTPRSAEGTGKRRKSWLSGLLELGE